MNRRKTPRDPAPAHTTDGESSSHQETSRSRSRKFKILMLVFSLMLFVVLDLICGTFLDIDQQRSFRRPHPYYHHALRANQQRRTHWGGHHYSMITNSLGFRDSEKREVQLQREKPRVVVIGDSMIEGLGVNYKDTVAGRLKSRWGGKQIEVLNAGVVSFSPHLYYLKTRYLLEEVGLQFSHLIVFIDISDIQDETFYESFQPSLNDNQLADWWRRHSLLLQVASQFAAQRPNNQFRTDAEVNVWMEATDAYHSGADPEIGRWEWTINDDIYNQWGKKGLALARQHMTQLKELCQKHEIDLTVVIYPSPVQIFANDRDSIQVRFWREFCEESDLPLINLFPTFIDHSVAGPTEIYKRYFIFSDSHWNASGHRMVAEKIDEAVGPTLGTD